MVSKIQLGNMGRLQQQIPHWLQESTRQELKKFVTITECSTIYIYTWSSCGENAESIPENEDGLSEIKETGSGMK